MAPATERTTRGSDTLRLRPSSSVGTGALQLASACLTLPAWQARRDLAQGGRGTDVDVEQTWMWTWTWMWDVDVDRVGRKLPLRTWIGNRHGRGDCVDMGVEWT